MILAGYLRKHPGDIEFGTNSHGKPFVMPDDADSAGRLGFSLSHCDTHAVVAVAATGMVGIDIEQRRQGIDAQGLASRFFAPEESEAMARLAGRDADSHFMLMWTCKEAFIKAIGLGLAYPLDRILVRNTGCDAPHLAPVDAEHGPPGAWSLRTWRLDPDRCIAVVIKREALTVNSFIVSAGLQIVQDRGELEHDAACSGYGSGTGAPGHG
jgi:4'-phosphopantetheinyl transferase